MRHLKIHKEAYKCGHCEKCFVNIQALTRQSVVHTDEKIDCNICGEKCSVKANLVRHKKNKHSWVYLILFFRLITKYSCLGLHGNFLDLGKSY